MSQKLHFYHRGQLCKCFLLVYLFSHVALFDIIYWLELKNSLCAMLCGSIHRRTVGVFICLLLCVAESIRRCFDAVLMHSIAEDHLLCLELIGATGVSRDHLFFFPVFTPTHLNGSDQAVRLAIDQ